MKSMMKYFVASFVVAMSVFAAGNEADRALKNKYISKLQGDGQISNLVLQNNYQRNILGDLPFSFRVKYIAEGGFGKVYEIIISPVKKANINEFSAIAKVLMKVPKDDFGNESIKKLIMNAKLLSKSPYFLGVLGLMNNQASLTRADQGVDTEHPVILIEKGLEDLNALFVKSLAGSGKVRIRDIAAKDDDKITISGYTASGLEEKEYPLPKLLKEMAGGVAFMHKNNLAHLDLKPQNMLMGVDSVVKIIDTDDAVEMSGPTNQYPGGSFSVPYTPPERANAILERSGVNTKGIFGAFKKAPMIDWRKADVYALGLSMLSIVTGLNPVKILLWGLNCYDKPDKNLLEESTPANELKCVVDAPNLFPIIGKGVLNDTLAKKRLPGTDAYRPLYDLIVKMLAADPAKRPSIEDVQAELNRIYP